MAMSPVQEFALRQILADPSIRSTFDELSSDFDDWWNTDVADSLGLNPFASDTSTFNYPFTGPGQWPFDVEKYYPHSAELGDRICDPNDVVKDLSAISGMSVSHVAYGGFKLCGKTFIARCPAGKLFLGWRKIVRSSGDIFWKIQCASRDDLKRILWVAATERERGDCYPNKVNPEYPLLSDEKCKNPCAPLKTVGRWPDGSPKCETLSESTLRKRKKEVATCRKKWLARGYAPVIVEEICSPIWIGKDPVPPLEPPYDPYDPSNDPFGPPPSSYFDDPGDKYPKDPTPPKDPSPPSDARPKGVSDFMDCFLKYVNEGKSGEEIEILCEKFKKKSLPSIPTVATVPPPPPPHTTCIETLVGRGIPRNLAEFVCEGVVTIKDLKKVLDAYPGKKAPSPGKIISVPLTPKQTCLQTLVGRGIPLSWAKLICEDVITEEDLKRVLEKYPGRKPASPGKVLYIPPSLKKTCFDTLVGRGIPAKWAKFLCRDVVTEADLKKILDQYYKRKSPSPGKIISVPLTPKQTCLQTLVGRGIPLKFAKFLCEDVFTEADLRRVLEKFPGRKPASPGKVLSLPKTPKQTCLEKLVGRKIPLRLAVFLCKDVVTEKDLQIVLERFTGKKRSISPSGTGSISAKKRLPEKRYVFVDPTKPTHLLTDIEIKSLPPIELKRRREEVTVSRKYPVPVWVNSAPALDHKYGDREVEVRKAYLEGR